MVKRAGPSSLLAMAKEDFDEAGRLKSKEQRVRAAMAQLVGPEIELLHGK